MERIYFISLGVCGLGVFIYALIGIFRMKHLKK